MMSQMLWNSTESSPALDDTFIMMSSSQFELSPLLTVPTQLTTENDCGQLCRPSTVVEAPRGTEQNSSGPSRNQQGGGSVAGQAGQMPVGEVLESSGQQLPAGGAGGGDQPPRRNAPGGEPQDEMGDSHEHQSGESTTTSSGSSLPELVPPCDPAIAPLLYPSMNSTPSEQTSNSDCRAPSEASTALVSDNEGHESLQQQQQHGDVSDAPEVAMTSTSFIHVETKTVSSSTSSDPPPLLDTTLSTLSSYTSTSSGNSKAGKCKSASDSCQMDASKDTSKESTGEVHFELQSSHDIFGSHGEYFMSTPSESVKVISHAQLSDVVGTVVELDESDTVIPPTPAELDVGCVEISTSLSATILPTEPTNQVDLGGALPEEEKQVEILLDQDPATTCEKPKKRPIGLKLDIAASASSVKLPKPSRKEVAEMTAKASLEEFLMKSMCKPGDDPHNKSNVLSSTEPSTKVMRKIAFESTSSEESSLPMQGSHTEKSSSSNGCDVRGDCPKKRRDPRSLDGVYSESGESDASGLRCKRFKPLTVSTEEEKSHDGLESEKTCVAVRSDDTSIAAASKKETAVSESDVSVPGETEDDDVENTEEEDFILRFSPSQMAESQYFPLVPEANNNATSKENTNADRAPLCGDPKEGGQQSVVGSTTISVDQVPKLSINFETDSEELPVPTFNLERPCQDASESSSSKVPRSAEVVVHDGDEPGTSGACARSKQEESAAEENPFDSCHLVRDDGAKVRTVSSTKKSATDDDVVDTPVCPVGRHKRKNVWLEDESGKSRKRQRREVKGVGCQVDLDKESGAKGDRVKQDASPRSVPENRDQAIQTLATSPEFSSGADVLDGVDRGHAVIKRTTWLKRIIVEELQNGKVINTRMHEEEVREPVITYLSRRGPFVQPKLSPEECTSPKSSSTVSLNKSTSSSSLTSGILGDLSKSSTPSSKQLSGDEQQQQQQQASGEMRTLRSVRRRKFIEARKNLNLSESDSTPEHVAAAASLAGATASKPQPTSKKAGRPKSTGQRSVVQRTTKSGQSGGDSAGDFVKRPVKMSAQSGGFPDGHGEAAAATTASASSGISSSKAAKPSTSAGSVQSTAGVRMMAKWKDGYYYSANILSKEGDDRVRVQYYDGKIQSIREGDVLMVDVLPVGQSIYVESPDGYFEPGIIVGCYSEDDGTTGYVVETDAHVSRQVPRSQVILTRDQAACLEIGGTTSATYSVASISLDNLVEGKRRSQKTSNSSFAVSTKWQSPRRSRTTTNVSGESALAAVATGDMPAAHHGACSAEAAASSSSSSSSNKSESKRREKGDGRKTK